jgi:ACS family allantoate permease-like MFS transporter
MLLTLPNGPSTAWFLTPREREIAVQRLQNSASNQVRQYKIDQLLDMLKDPQVWLLFLYTFCINVGNGGLSSVRICAFRYRKTC